MTWRAPFSFIESSKASHTDRTGPPAMPQYLPTQPFYWHLHTRDPSSLLLSYLISWCQATYGSPSFPLVPSELMDGYLQMKRESSRMTSGPRIAVTTCKIWGCLVSAITQGYRRWTLWRLYWVYSLPGNTQTSAGSLLLTYLTSI